MPSFFKRKKKVEKLGKDTSIDSSELLGGEQADPESTKKINTKLFIHPDWKLATEEQYVYQFLHNQLEPLKENQLSLAGNEIKQVETAYMVSAFVRSSLPKAVKLDKIPISLVAADGTILARREFDLSQLGELPAESSMPWFFTFEQEHLKTTEIPETDWKLAFEIKREHKLDLAESWEKTLKEEDKEQLRQLVKSLTPPKQGEVNLLGIQASQSPDGRLHVTVLVRNGNNKTIVFPEIQLNFEDASGEIVAQGAFELKNFEVRSHTSKPWTFIFPKELITKEQLDLSTWKVYPIQ